MCDEPGDDDLMDAVLLEQQIEVGVGETAGAPVLLSGELDMDTDEGASVALTSAKCALLDKVDHCVSKGIVEAPHHVCKIEGPD
jgi:hypothetical protein